MILIFFWIYFMKKISIIVLFILSFSIAIAQQPPCMTDYHGYTYYQENLTHVSPLSLSMPYNVILGYIGLDTVSHYVTKSQFSDFINNQNFNDTLKSIMKYFYIMNDYNPLLYINTIHYSDNYLINPKNIRTIVLNRVREVSDLPYLDELLLNSDFIYHIRVTDTLRRIDPSYNNSEDLQAIVTGEILDVIKGKVIPGCKDISIHYDNSLNKNNDQKLQSVTATTGQCIQFEYMLDWHREKSSWDDISSTLLNDSGKILTPIMQDTNGVPWVIKGKEYIVFLHQLIICSDSQYSYFTIIPYVLPSSTCNIYPIENGNVNDPGNELGIGTNPSVIEFKNHIRNRINFITQ